MGDLFPSPPSPKPWLQPVFPQIPLPSDQRTEEDRDAAQKRRIAARQTGGNPNVFTSPLGITYPAKIQTPTLLGQ